MMTMLAEPRSSSLVHQLLRQSWGMKESSCATVADRRTTASFSNAGVPSRLALHPPEVPLPLVSKTLPVESSTTTPPAAQKPAPCPAAEGNVDVAVAQGQRSALLLDRPIESGQRQGRDHCAELDDAREEVQPLEAVKVVGRVEGDDVDAAPRRVDDGSAEDALR